MPRLLEDEDSDPLKLGRRVRLHNPRLPLIIFRMTLLTHAIVGAAVGKVIGKSNIWFGIIFAFLSHFAVDAIRHGHYSLRSKYKDENNPLNNDILINKSFLFDLLKIGADFFLGLIFAQLFFNGPNLEINWTIALYAFFGTLPDALQFAYFKIRKEPLTTLQRFHLFCHSKKHFNNNPKGAILVETITSFVSVIIAKFIF